MKKAFRYVVAVLILLFLAAFSDLFGQEAATIFTGCKVEKESTVNNQSDVVYWTCGPRVSFIVVKDSIPDLLLREKEGKTVDLKLVVVP